MAGRVTISIVTYNSRFFLLSCLDSIRAQTYGPVDVTVVDCASTDGTREILASRTDVARILALDRNLGFAAGQNVGIRTLQSEFVLVLNPDVILDPNFIASAVEAMRSDSSLGAVSGKLLRTFRNPTEAHVFPSSSVLDSTGFFPLRSGSNWERGSGELDRGQYDERSPVFGVTGAAAFFRRSALESVAPDGQYFDEDFFMYGEDVDLAWRLQLRGWSAQYRPEATARHARRYPDDVPRARREPRLNAHLVKNRYLVRLKNYPVPVFLRNFPHLLMWDVAMFSYILCFERSSLNGYLLLVRALPNVLRKRREVHRSRRLSFIEVLRAFDAEERQRHAGGRSSPVRALLTRWRQLNVNFGMHRGANAEWDDSRPVSTEPSDCTPKQSAKPE